LAIITLTIANATSPVPHGLDFFQVTGHDPYRRNC
jgi:hypothetical protein